MSDEQNGNGGADDGALDDGDGPTAVIVPRFGRDEFALGQRRLGDALAGFSSSLHAGARYVDEGTALGYAAVTKAEAEDLDELLEGLEQRVRGVRRVLKRAINPAPKTEP